MAPLITEHTYLQSYNLRICTETNQLKDYTFEQNKAVILCVGGVDLTQYIYTSISNWGGDWENHQPH